MRNTKFAGIVMAFTFAGVVGAQGDQFFADLPRAQEQALDGLADAASGQPTCDLRVVEEQPHCVPGPVRRVLEGKDWHLVQNFTPIAIETACMGGAKDACGLLQLAQDTLTKQAALRECRSINPGRSPAACRAMSKETVKAYKLSTDATIAAIIRPDGCCGTAMEAYSPESGRLAQFLLGFSNQINRMRYGCEASASARFHYGTAPWHQAYVYCLTH